MHTGKRYSNLEVLLWTRRNIYKLALISAVPVVFYDVFKWHWIALPWTVVALLGTATAFIVGFRNSQTYNRTWEARQIWGGVVNISRTFGLAARDFGAPADVQRRLVNRHIAWLTALRYAMREWRTWESTEDANNKEYQKKTYQVPEKILSVQEALRPYLEEEDLAVIMQAKNKATQVIALQSKELNSLYRAGIIGEYVFIEFQRLLKDILEMQGRSGRIKNFPYPRQFATINGLLVKFFIYLLPFCMLREFDKVRESLVGFAAEHVVWMVIPFSVLISWVFTSLDLIGQSTENPFEGSANDVPITQICRVIEIDLLQMLGEQDLPEPLGAQNNIVM